MRTVLVVDDDVIVRNFLRFALQRKGCAVADAKNHEEALAICKALEGRSLDLLIVDHVLSLHYGRKVAEQVLQLCPAVNILVISGSPFDVVLAQDGIVPGAVFLPKPFTVQQFDRAVDQMFNSEGPLERARSAAPDQC